MRLPEVEPVMHTESTADNTR